MVYCAPGFASDGADGIMALRARRLVPRRDVTPWIGDVAGTAGLRQVSYDVQTYENTCRPDATICGGCTLGTGCAYDGGAHTEPGWEQSAVLIEFR